jgi:hypothetical protein
MIFVATDDDMDTMPKPASDLQVGDELVLSNKESQGGPTTIVVKVTRLEFVVREGAYAPFTETGTIAVNGPVF